MHFAIKGWWEQCNWGITYIYGSQCYIGIMIAENAMDRLNNFEYYENHRTVKWPEFSYHCPAHFLLLPRPLLSMNSKNSWLLRKQLLVLYETVLASIVASYI